MKKLFVLAISAAICACSVTNVTLNYTVAQNQQGASVVSERKLTCSIFELPEFDPVPQIPLEEYAALPKNGNAARTQLLIDYIKRLRLHISTFRKTLKSSHRDYLNECGTE